MKRRNFLRYGGTGLVGAGAMALVGCGGDDDGGGSGATAEETRGAPLPTPTTAAPTPTTAASDLAADQTLKQRYFNDVLKLDPATIFGIEQENVIIQIYSGLTRYDDKTTIVSDLATGWETPDPTTYTFKLNDKAKWAKGNGDVTAEDVVFSYNRIITGPGSYKPEFSLIDSVTALDPHTVQVKLKKPDMNFPHQVANYHMGSIIPRKLVEADADGFFKAPIGSGPFMLSDVQPGVGFTLSRNDDYFLGKATIGKMTFQRIDDYNTAAIALKNGELDVFMAVRSEAALDTMKDDKNIQYSIGDNWGISLYMLNARRGQMGDPRVRQAMARAADFAAAVKATAPRISAVQYSYVPDWIPEYSNDYPKYTYDVKEAKALLDAAGVSNLNMKFMTTAGSEFVTLLQASWAQVGIKMDLELVDRAQFNARRVSGDYDMTNRGFPAANIDQINFNYLSPANMPPNGFNGAYYDNPEVVSKMEAARSELDKTKRLQLYAEVQKQVMTDLPYLVTNGSNEYWAFRSNMKGVVCNRMPQSWMYPYAKAKG